MKVTREQIHYGQKIVNIAKRAEAAYPKHHAIIGQTAYALVRSVLDNTLFHKLMNPDEAFSLERLNSVAPPDK